MKGFKISSFQGGDGTAISQTIIDLNKATDLDGSVFTYRCHKNGYEKERPTALCIPISPLGEKLIQGYQQELKEAGLNSIYRRTKRCNSSFGEWEVKIFFPHNWTANRAIQFLVDEKLDKYLPF